MTKELVLDIKRVIDSKLTFDQYFILYCIKNNVTELLDLYNINPDIYFSLLDLKLIEQKIGHSENYHELLSLTSIGLRALSESKLPINGECNFEGFKATYTNRVNLYDGTVRRLHGNMDVCESLYEKLLLETTHDILCKCSKLYCEEQLKTENGKYTKLLETWLRQKIYKLYLDNIDKVEENLNDHDII